MSKKKQSLLPIPTPSLTIMPPPPSSEEMEKSIAKLLGKTTDKKPPPVLTNSAISGEKMQEIAAEMGNEIMGEKDAQTLPERKLKIDIFQFLEKKYGKPVNLTEPLPQGFDMSDVIDIAEEFARLNNADIPIEIPDAPEEAYRKGDIAGMGMQLSKIINQDPEVFSDGEILEDIITYLKKWNLYTITGKF